MLNVELFLEASIKLNISEKHLGVLILKINGKQSLQYKYQIESKSPLSQEDINGLINKGYLKNIENEEWDLHFDHIEVTDFFKRKFFEIYPEGMFEEFWNKYPITNLKEYQKANNLNDEMAYDEMCELYLGKFQLDFVGHQEIIANLEMNKLNKTLMPLKIQFLKQYL